MNAKTKVLLAIALFVFLILQIVGGIGGALTDPDYGWGWDLRLRYHEIQCAHQGVNSFRIWNREIQLPGFAPLHRPDMEDVPCSATDAVVHAYPPWHTAVFYFYGWFPEQMCLFVMALVYGLCLYFIVGECVRLSRERFGHGGLVAFCSLTLIACFAMIGFQVLNYGVMVLVAFLLMNKAIEKGGAWCDVVVGLAWSVMMLKPQVGLLFVWPLLWRRRYLAIVIATAVCLGETVVASFLVHESPIDLILQVPLIGKPYKSSCMFATAVLNPIFGDYSMSVLMVVFFVLTGVATWLLRKNRDFLVLCLPVVLAIPLWTYCNLLDRVIMLPAFIVMAGMAFSANKFGRWGMVTLAYCLAVAGSSVLRVFRVFGPAGGLASPRLDVVLILAANVSLFAFLLMMVYEELRRDYTRPPTRGA